MAAAKEGFFKKFHDAVNNSLDNVVRNNFINLETNAKRVSYLSNLASIKNYDLRGHLSAVAFPEQKKEVGKARQIKSEGNVAFQKGDWPKSLQLYTESLLNVPKEETEEESIILANRSACLNHMKYHEETLQDIRRCLALNYPRHLHYKVLERKASCLLALHRKREAVTAFQDLITALDEAEKLDKTKRSKLATDAKIMIELLKKGASQAGNPEDPKPILSPPHKPKLAGTADQHYPSASKAIQIDYEDDKGRFATATRDISAGETILFEKPHSAVLLAEYSKTHCQHCFDPCLNPLPCPMCPNVMFCGQDCLEAALKSYHGYECHILPIIWASGCSVTCHIALRIILQSNKEHFTNIYQTLGDTPSGPYRSEDYRTLYHLVTHEERRTKEDFLHRTQMAVFLLKLMEVSGYFGEGLRETPISINEFKTMGVDEKYKVDVAIFGDLLLKNLQVLQFNAHEVFELQCKKPKGTANVIKHNGNTVFIAGAIFPTLALFNHSCDPSVVRYFSGKTIVVRTVKNIKKGEEVSENYGPIFTTVPKQKRQADLKEQYWFDCNCIACKQDWPLYQQMNEDYMRFKCDSTVPCPNAIPVPQDSKEFMIQCGLCQQYTNILKGLKSLQNTDVVYNTGKVFMDAGKYEQAFRQFVEVLKLYDSTLLPPYASYYVCVQDLRRCMLSMGNCRFV